MAIDQALFKGYTRIGDLEYSVDVQFRDTTKTPTTFMRSFRIKGQTLAELREDIATQIDAVRKADTRQDLLAGIAIDTSLPLAPTAPTGPTQGELDDAAWVSNVRLLVRAKAAQSAGLSHATFTTDLTNLTNSVNSGYTTARAQKL